MPVQHCEVPLLSLSQAMTTVLFGVFPLSCYTHRFAARAPSCVFFICLFCFYHCLIVFSTVRCTLFYCHSPSFLRSHPFMHTPQKRTFPHRSGDIITIALHEIRVFTVNGELLASTNTMWFGLGATTAACCTRCVLAPIHAFSIVLVCVWASARAGCLKLSARC